MGKKAEAIETGKADGVYFGLMSGTSMDGVDGVAVQFATGRPPVVLGEAHVSFSQGLRDALFALQAPGAALVPVDVVAVGVVEFEGGVAPPAEPQAAITTAAVVTNARTLPLTGFSFAVSGRTMPLAVVSSSSIARTINRSPRGLSFM